jgi:hypothetical protein
VRSLGHRIFTGDEEQQFFDRIRHEISMLGTLFTDEDFRMLEMEEYIARYDENTPWDEIHDFHASPRFVASFKRRKRLSS